jgi:hypothetical protein
LGKAQAIWPVVVAFGRPTPLVHGQSVATACSTRGHRVVCDLCTWCGTLLNGVMVVYQ